MIPHFVESYTLRLCVGSGGYCDNSAGAVSTTGHGESITKVCLAHRIIMQMQQGEYS